jgi:hypothetical protein
MGMRIPTLRLFQLRRCLRLQTLCVLMPVHLFVAAEMAVRQAVAQLREED